MYSCAAAGEHSIDQAVEGQPGVAASAVDDWWHNDCAVSQLSRGDDGVLTKQKVPRGEVIIRAGGVVADCGSDPFPLYKTYLEELAAYSERDTAARDRLQSWVASLCPADSELESHLKENPLKEEMESSLSSLLLQLGNPMTLAELSKLTIKFERNAFAEGAFRLVTKLNHSCRPNCLAHFDKKAKQMVIMTTDDVPAGTELTINYLPESQWHLPTDQRRSILQRRYGFRCMCERCDCHSPAYQANSASKSIAMAEISLESMQCTQNGCKTGYCKPLDNHTAIDAPPDGWSVCSRCNTKPDFSMLDNMLSECYSKMIRIEAIWTMFQDRDDSSTEITEAILKNVIQICFSVIQYLEQKLHPHHWILCRVYFLVGRIMDKVQAACGIALADLEIADDYSFHAGSLFFVAARLRAGCDTKAVFSFLPIIPERSNLAGTLFQRAAEAKRTESILLKRDGHPEAEMCNLMFKEFEKKAINILRSIWKVCNTE